MRPAPVLAAVLAWSLLASGSALGLQAPAGEPGAWAPGQAPAAQEALLGAAAACASASPCATTAWAATGPTWHVLVLAGRDVGIEAQGPACLAHAPLKAMPLPSTSAQPTVAYLCRGEALIREDTVIVAWFLGTAALATAEFADQLHEDVGGKVTLVVALAVQAGANLASQAAFAASLAQAAVRDAQSTNFVCSSCGWFVPYVVACVPQEEPPAHPAWRCPTVHAYAWRDAATAGASQAAQGPEAAATFAFSFAVDRQREAMDGVRDIVEA